MKSQLLSTVSHELRTPLASIKGFATTLLREDVEWDEASRREFLSIIDEESDRLSELISNLLDMSRIEAGTLRVEPEPTDLRPIIQETVAEFQVMTRDHQFQAATASCPAAGDGRSAPHPPGSAQPGGKRGQVLAGGGGRSAFRARPQRRRRADQRGRPGPRHRSRNSWSTSLTASTRWIAPRRARWVAAAWACPSARPSSRPTMGASGQRASQALAAPSISRCPWPSQESRQEHDHG